MRLSKKKITLIILGMAILAFGMYNIHSRSNITEGGVLGMTLLIQHWFHVSPAISSLVLDISFFALGLFTLGKGFLIDSLLASISFSIWYRLFEIIGPLLPDMSGYPLVGAVVGGIFVGIGTGLVVQFGGAAGGDDALALVLHNKLNVQVSTVYYIFDTCVMLLSLTYIPLVRIAYSLLSVYISSTIINVIHIHGPKAFKISSDEIV